MVGRQRVLEEEPLPGHGSSVVVVESVRARQAVAAEVEFGEEAAVDALEVDSEVEVAASGEVAAGGFAAWPATNRHEPQASDPAHQRPAMQRGAGATTSSKRSTEDQDAGGQLQ